MRIGNAGNSDDTSHIIPDQPEPLGAVVYPFRMGMTEVTNYQYAGFLNAVAASDPYHLYSENMGSETWGGIVRSGIDGAYSYAVKSPARGGAYTYDDKPVVYVGWLHAIRFVNWMHNGQGDREPPKLRVHAVRRHADSLQYQRHHTQSGCPVVAPQRGRVVQGRLLRPTFRRLLRLSYREQLAKRAE